MLEPETLKPYLLDDDPYVRCAAARYFYEGWLQDEELIPLALDVCDRFGYSDSVSLPACCRHLLRSTMHLGTHSLHDILLRR